MPRLIDAHWHSMFNFLPISRVLSTNFMKLAKWYAPFEALKMATHDNAQLLKLSGPRDLYPGEPGVIYKNTLE